MCPKPNVEFVDCLLSLKNELFVAPKAQKLIFDNMCEKSCVDFVDSGWPEPKIWAHENNVDYVAPKAQKLISDNMCEKSYVDFVDSGWTKPKIWGL